MMTAKKSHKPARWLLALGLAVVGGACSEDEPSQAGGGVSREEVAQAGEELVGRTVTVSGLVNDGYGSRAIEIAGEGAFFDGAPVLVVGRDLPSAAAGARLEVTGTVRAFDLAEIEREVGALPIEPGDFEVAIFAEEVRVIQPSGTLENGMPYLGPASSGDEREVSSEADREP